MGYQVTLLEFLLCVAKANAVEQEPLRFLRDAKCAVRFLTGDPFSQFGEFPLSKISLGLKCMAEHFETGSFAR
jgi:hypothetical protein